MQAEDKKKYLEVLSVAKKKIKHFNLGSSL